MRLDLAAYRDGMAECCRGGPCEQVFGTGSAQRELRRYRKRGLSSLERRLADAARRNGLAGARVLEIGGGIGVLQAELLLAGASTGEVIELVPAYAPYARELARTTGLGDRSTFRVVDLLDHPEQAAGAEVVLLNRVVCCSPDGLDLTALAASLARGTLIVSFPRYLAWTRLASRLENALCHVRGLAYRSFVRPAGDIVNAATSTGLRVVEHGRTRAWEFVALRADEASGIA